ncbi:MAG: tetratricopeptide repeat protein, partial [Fibrobacter sp.]|nr:tetratricopeptide repeat protein [Fibrobacter sp.]
AEGEEYLEAKEELAEELLALKQYNHFRDTLNNLSYGADVEIHNPALAGYFWYRRGEFAKSVKNLGPIAKDIGDNAVLLDILANAYFLTGDGKKALEVFEDAIKDSPTNWELRLAYADFTGKLGDYDTAEIHLQAVIDGAYDDYDEMVKLLPHIKRLGSREQITQVTNIVEEFEKEFETEVDLE